MKVKKIFVSTLPFLLFSILFILFALGMMMIFNTTAAEILDTSRDTPLHYTPMRHLLIALLSLISGFSLSLIEYRTLLQISPFLFFLSFLALCLVFVPGIGKSVNGSYRWLSLFGVSWQPSEFFQLILPLYTTYSLEKNEKILTSLRPFLSLLFWLSLPLIAILLEPNNSSVLILGMILLQLFFISGTRPLFWFLPLVLFVSMGMLTLSQFPYVSSRIEVFLHPEKDLRGRGHQPYQAKIAAGSGRLFGKGLGNSLQKFSYLPEAQNDYIAAIFAEEMGFWGIFFLIVLYMGLTYLGAFISHHAPHRSGLILGSSVTFFLSIQAFLNLAVVCGLFPSTGLNLPFFSQGGTNFLVNSMGVGILYSIHRERKRKSFFKSA